MVFLANVPYDNYLLQYPQTRLYVLINAPMLHPRPENRGPAFSVSEPVLVPGPVQGSGCEVRRIIDLDSERGNFRLFGLIKWLYLRKFELFGPRLLKKRVDDYIGSIGIECLGLKGLGFRGLGFRASGWQFLGLGTRDL